MLKKPLRILLRTALYIVSSFLLVGLTLLIGHAVMVRNGPELQWWHTQEISAEFVDSDKDKVRTLDQYLAKEARVFAELETLEAANIQQDRHHHLNRYRKGSDSYPVKNDQNFNLTQEWKPENIKGGVLLLHGLTDSPYSLRHLGEMFASQGYYVLSLRMPGHGTIPAELNRMKWQDWQAAAELGGKHVGMVVGEQLPFYIVGYSNGGSLALKYSLDSISDNDLPVPDRVFLLSPMIGVDTLAKYSPIFLWLGDLQFFSKSRWIDVLPEYDPHKYNSFPVNAALQSYRITSAVTSQIDRMQANGEIQDMPPVLAFQSLVDRTVISSTLYDNLFQKLPANGSELVLFDVNQFGDLKEFLLPRHHALLERIKNDNDGQYSLSIISNQTTGSRSIAEIRRAPDETEFKSQQLPYSWPAGVYSLTHVSLPFPLDDEIYGLESSGEHSEFPRLGRVQVLGEAGALILPPALLQRLRSNPFYEYIESRISETISTDQSTH